MLVQTVLCFGDFIRGKNLYLKHPVLHRPPLPSGNAFVQPIERCGRSVGEKLTQLREDLARLGAEAMVVPALDECAWLLNVRGNDVVFNPVVISYILVTKET